MKDMFSRIKSTFTGQQYTDENAGEEYLELNQSAEDVKAKITIRPYVLEDFSDIKNILDALREGYTIPLINIRPLKEKDVTELKRAINKLKKTTEALGGEIAGFGEDWLVIAPSFAQIYKNKKVAVETQAAAKQQAGKQSARSDEDDLNISEY